MQTWLAFLVNTVWETFFPHLTSFSVDFTYICENVLSSKHTNTHACPRPLTVIVNIVKSMLLSVVLTSTLQYCLLPICLDNLLWGVIWIQTAYTHLVHWQLMCLVNVIPYANTWPFWCGRDSNFWVFYQRKDQRKGVKSQTMPKIVCVHMHVFVERETDWETQVSKKKNESENQGWFSKLGDQRKIGFN